MPRATPLSAEERRAAILAATEPLLVRHGRSVSTREIAAAAGIAEGTIFRVFPSKDALIDAVVEDAFEPSAVCRALADIDRGLDLEARLVQVAELLHARLTRVVALFHTLTTRSDSSRPLPAARLDRQRAQELMQREVSAVLAPDAGRLRVSPEEAATLLTGMLMASAHPLLPGDTAPQPPQIVAVLLHGILAGERPC